MRLSRQVPVYFAALLIVAGVLAQDPARQTGVLRLRVRVKADDAAPFRGLARKRFFLIPGTLEQNRALVDAVRTLAAASTAIHAPALPGAASEGGLRFAIDNRTIIHGNVTAANADAVIADVRAASAEGLTASLEKTFGVNLGDIRRFRGGYPS